MLENRNANENIPIAVREATLFEGIVSHARQLIAKNAERCEVEDNLLIIRKGEQATHLFLLTSGRAKYSRVTKSGQELLLWRLSPGDVFGLSTLLRNPSDYIGSVEAITRCELLVWKHPAIRKLLTAYPQIYENALRISLRYLSQYAERHAAVMTQSAEQRLAHALIHLGNRAGHCHDRQVEVEITNEQLGQLADVGLYTATRFLSAWQRKGIIAKKRGKVVIKAPERLPFD